MVSMRRLLCVWLGVVIAPIGIASAQIRPRIMLTVDTSGSMGQDVNGIPTFGDGITTGCTVGASGQHCGTDCTAGIDTNCDGEPNDSRIYIAKESIRDTILAWGGDIDLGLARFRQLQGLRTTCSGLVTQINNYECSFGGPFVTSYGNPQCNTGANVDGVAPGTNCPLDWQSFWPAACRPGSGGRPNLRLFNAATSPSVCGNYRGDCGTAATGGGDVLVGFPGIAPFATSSNVPAILKWIDNVESNPLLTATTAGDWCTHSGAGDCELRPEGGTPIAGALNFIGGSALYGRYWGCLVDKPFLHFELCYYRAIDEAIARGLERVEAGAQGGHKLARGYEPVQTFSAHWIADGGFRAAVADFLDRERRGIAVDQLHLSKRTPFRKEG